MSGQVLSFPSARGASAADDGEALLAVVRELHALITIDPILGASPVRIYFVLNPRAVERIIAALRPADPAARAASCFALIAYDFPFALHQFALTASPIPTERAREIIVIDCWRSLLSAQKAGLVT